VVFAPLTNMSAHTAGAPKLNIHSAQTNFPFTFDILFSTS
jgi:hypothetical protein